jgi:hypothetical protein
MPQKVHTFAGFRVLMRPMSAFDSVFSTARFSIDFIKKESLQSDRIPL